MFRVAVVVNENEVAHSVFADAISVLKKPVTMGDLKKEYYQFVPFGKFNIDKLFKNDDECHLMSFDSLIIATNASDDRSLYSVLVSHKDDIERFICAGKGVFVSSQKKLATRIDAATNEISILPSKYDYCLVERPEKSSAEGIISIFNENDLVLSYPSVINEELIEYRCTNNSFMPHKYRSHIIPRDSSQYISILIDKTGEVPSVLENEFEKHRKVLLRSANLSERVIISTMALDWASHEELLENILVYITEGVSRFAFIRKPIANGIDALASYTLRAKISKIPFRVYENPTIDALAKLQHSIYIFDPQFSELEVNEFWKKCNQDNKFVTIYHLVVVENALVLRELTSETSIDSILLEVVHWLSGYFYPQLWGKSMWTYNYTLLMMKDLNVDFTSYLPHIYNELSLHFTKDATIIDSYDRVTNATCMMLEVLFFIYLDNTNIKDCAAEQYPIIDLYNKVLIWLIEKLANDSSTKFDCLYITKTLLKIGYEEKLNDNEQVNFWETILTVIKSFPNLMEYSNVTLCQLAYIIARITSTPKAKSVLPANEARKRLREVVILILERQSDNGEWSNISETGEVATLLLQLKRSFDSLVESLSVEFNERIILAIEYLYAKYDRYNNCWSNDINATVRAMHAIGLFDIVYNFSVSDFFFEVSNKGNKALVNANVSNQINALQTAIAGIQERDQIVKKLNGEVNHQSKEIESIKKKKVFYRNLFWGAFVMLLCLGFMAVLVGLGLSSHEEILLELFNNWRAEFIFAFVGFIVGFLFMGIYGFIKSRLLLNE